MQLDEQQTARARAVEDPIRVLALSDGVFAIIMTILVLELRVPTFSNGTELTDWFITDGGRMLLVYAGSFLLAGYYWMGHRRMFSLVKHFDVPLLWLNNMFLMLAALIPFAASLISKHPAMAVARQCYQILLFALSIQLVAIFLYISFRPRLSAKSLPYAGRNEVVLVLVCASALFLTATVITPYYPELALILSLTTPLLYGFVAHGVTRRIAHHEALSEQTGVAGHDAGHAHGREMYPH